MKRQWLLVLIPVVLIAALVGLKYFSGKRAKQSTPSATSPAATTTPARVEIAVADNKPTYEIPKRGARDKKQNLPPDAVEKISTTLETWVKAHPKAPDLPDAYYNLGNLYYESGQYEKAIEPLQKAIAGNPSDADAHYTLGNAYDKLKRYAEAAKEFEILVKLEPKNGAVLYNLANAYLYQQKFQPAAEQYQKAIALDNKNASAYYGSGMAYLNLKRNKEALASFQQAVKLEPDNAEARYYLAMLKIESGDKRGAAEQQDYLRKIKAEYADDIAKKLSQ